MRPRQAVRYDEHGRPIDLALDRQRILAHAVSGTGNLPSFYEMRVKRLKEAGKALEQAINSGNIQLITAASDAVMNEQKKWVNVPTLPPFVQDIRKLLEQANRLAPRQSMAPRNNM